MKLGMIFKTIGGVLKKNSSGILMGAGIAGFGLSCYFSAKAYDECKNRLEKKKEEIGQDTLPITETIKVCWKPMLLPTISFISSSIMVLYSRNIILKKNAALLLAYKGAETALTEFQNETKAKVGEEVFKEIKDKATEKQMQKEEVPETFNKKTYLDSQKELYYDGTYGGYFYATPLEIERAFQEMRDELSWIRYTSDSKYCSSGIVVNKDCKEGVKLMDIYYRLHNEPLGIGDDYAYFFEDYMHSTFDYTISDTYMTAPNGARALVIYYDKAKPVD